MIHFDEIYETPADNHGLATAVEAKIGVTGTSLLLQIDIAEDFIGASAAKVFAGIFSRSSCI